jgi:hypothetical protein
VFSILAFDLPLTDRLSTLAVQKQYGLYLLGNLCTRDSVFGTLITVTSEQVSAAIKLVV